ncbi:hypothetical protein OIU79_012062 [Salix purpurea]|uniref:Uncharacterized protein n=1 Tax=Salix purpurea TaxID=77065 RepID=A0A9Q0T2L7_SALPP|nr:hypothetical protein OIU79_012062 [Salix purpurea]
MCEYKLLLNPPCVQNSPYPLSLTLSKNPDGKAWLSSAWLLSSAGKFRTRKNGKPVSSKPRASSFIWSWFKNDSLPNEQKITDLAGN